MDEPNRTWFGQIATAAKSNEITAIPELLDTICARCDGCQREIAEKIVARGESIVMKRRRVGWDNDYLFTVLAAAAPR